MTDPYSIPTAYPGMVVGLYGGTFDPPHEGHRHVAHQAIKRLGLDKLWWIVTPGNPLKDNGKLTPLSDRIKAARHLSANHPKIVVSAFETTLGSAYTAATIATLKQRHPDVRFIWIMGSDNLVSFHRWQKWQKIMANVPIAIVERPGSTFACLSSKTAHAFRKYQKPESSSAVLAHQSAPAWTFLHGHRIPLSSTDLRLLKQMEKMS